MKRFLRRYPFTTVLVAGIWVLCLIPIPETPLDHVRLIDKWTHITFYIVLSLTAGIEYRRAHRGAGWKRMLVISLLLPVLMGGLIEIVQATCTGGRRSGDWLDFAADGVGAIIGWIIGQVYLYSSGTSSRQFQ